VKYFKFNFCWSCSLGESWQTKRRNCYSLYFRHTIG